MWQSSLSWVGFTPLPLSNTSWNFLNAIWPRLMKLDDNCFHLHFPPKLYWLTYVMVFQYKRYFCPIKDDTPFTLYCNVVNNNGHHDGRKILFSPDSSNEGESGYKDKQFHPTEKSTSWVKFFQIFTFVGTRLIWLLL